jgi:hypothetical protein
MLSSVALTWSNAPYRFVVATRLSDGGASHQVNTFLTVFDIFHPTYKGNRGPETGRYIELGPRCGQIDSLVIA